KAVIAGGQLARRYGFPYRTSSTNAANTVDAQAAYESVFSLWGVIEGGGNFVMHAAGWTEGGLTASFEKFILDVDLLQMVAEFLRLPGATAAPLRAAPSPTSAPAAISSAPPIHWRATRAPSMRRSSPTGATTRPGSRPEAPPPSDAPTRSTGRCWRITNRHRSTRRSRRSWMPSSPDARKKVA